MTRSRWLRWAVGLAVLAVIGAAGSNWWLLSRTRSRIYPTATAIPGHDVAIVLGTSPWRSGGGANPFFTGRMEAAAELYRAGKVRHFLLSGDNRTREYDEPAAMAVALVERGVPASALTVDDAGFRTLDTMARAARVFGLTQATIVTDDFHLARALFLARAFGIDAVGYASTPVPLRLSRKTRLRELAGRTVAFLDVYLLRTQPKFYGPHETLGRGGS